MDYFFGSVTVRLTGFLSAARIAAIAQSIPLRDIRRYGDALEMRVLLPDVKRLRMLLHGQKVRMRILQRSGLPFLRVVLRRHRGFVLWLATALLILLYLSGTVLAVRVSGTKNTLLCQELLAQMEELGVRKGVSAQGINRRQVEATIQDGHPQLTFVSLKRRGCLLELFVVEATQPPQVADKSEPCDVIAGCNGLITNVTVFSGTALVRPGDTVRQGQVLIRGMDSTGRSCRASGQVFARLWQTGRGEAELYSQVRNRTGRQQSQTKLSVLGYAIPWFSRSIDYEQYDVSHEKGRILDGLFIPITWDRMTAYEVKAVKKDRERGEVRRQAAQRALSRALALVPNGAQVVDKRLEYSKIENEKLSASLTLETLAQIGIQREGTGGIWED